MLFNLPQKFFSFLRYLDFCPDVFGYVEKQLVRKAKVKELRYTYCSISQVLSQADNEILSFNRI